MFTGMQQNYNSLKQECDEVVRSVARYQEELHHKKEELRSATEVLEDCKHSLLSMEKDKEHVGLERDRARANLEQAKALLQEKERSL